MGKQCGRVRMRRRLVPRVRTGAWTIPPNLTGGRTLLHLLGPGGSGLCTHTRKMGLMQHALQKRPSLKRGASKMAGPFLSMITVVVAMSTHLPEK